MPTPPSARVTTVLMAGVPVEVTGPTTVLPAMPDQAHMEVIWPTSQVALYTSVLMNNGERWTSQPAPRRTAQGGITVSLTSPVNVTIALTVPRYGLETPMWWVGELPPPAPGEVEGNGEQSNEPPPPVPDVPTGESAG